MLRVPCFINNLIKAKELCLLKMRLPNGKTTEHERHCFQMIGRQSVARCLQHSLRVSRTHVRLESIRRTNPLGIQMLSSKLHQQLFSAVGEPAYSAENVAKSTEHLKKFELGSTASEVLDDVEFDLPPLKHADLNAHFKTIAQQQSQPYVDLIRQLINATVPPQPTKWNYAKGWTKFVLSIRAHYRVLFCCKVFRGWPNDDCSQLPG